jgi:hypothetical protein
LWRSSGFEVLFNLAFHLLLGQLLLHFEKIICEVFEIGRLDGFGRLEGVVVVDFVDHHEIVGKDEVFGQLEYETASEGLHKFCQIHAEGSAGESVGFCVPISLNRIVKSIRAKVKIKGIFSGKLLL